MNAIKNFMLDEEGAAAVEYGLLAVLIAVGIIVGVKALGDDLCGVFKGLGTFLKNGGTYAAGTCAAAAP